MDQRDVMQDFYRLKSPCKNCPFLREGGIELRPGALDGIISSLLDDDSKSFLCHKTLNSDYADDHGSDNDEPHGRPLLSGEKMCAGAASYLLKAQRPTIGMRLAIIAGSIARDHWDEAMPVVIETPESN